MNSIDFATDSTSIVDTNSSKSSTRLADAAKQFESLLISQMLKSARESDGGGWLSDGDETGEDSSMGMAEEQFAQSLASNGGLGLAKMIVKTMSAKDQEGNSGSVDSPKSTN